MGRSPQAAAHAEGAAATIASAVRWASAMVEIIGFTPVAVGRPASCAHCSRTPEGVRRQLDQLTVGPPPSVEAAGRLTLKSAVGVGRRARTSGRALLAMK